MAMVSRLHPSDFEEEMFGNYPTQLEEMVVEEELKRKKKEASKKLEPVSTKADEPVSPEVAEVMMNKALNLLICDSGASTFELIRKENKNYARLVHQWLGGMEFLHACGFIDMQDEFGVEYLVLSDQRLEDDVVAMGQLKLNTAIGNQVGGNSAEEVAAKRRLYINASSDTNAPQKSNSGDEEESVLFLSDSRRFSFGFAETIGRRPTMEDRLALHGMYRGKANEDLFCLFDGHGGSEVSEFSAIHFGSVFAENLRRGQKKMLGLDVVFRDTYLDVNRQVSESGLIGGTTALTIYFDSRRGHVANAGDSRAVLCRDGEAIRMSYDHKPDAPDEESRIISVGGFISGMNGDGGVPRVSGVLAVSRALGDIYLQPSVIADPYTNIASIDLADSANEFLIVACDGLWDVVLDHEAVNEVRVLATQRPHDAAVRLRDLAFARGSGDNISVIVICLNKSGVQQTVPEIPSTPTHANDFGRFDSSSGEHTASELAAAASTVSDDTQASDYVMNNVPAVMDG